MAELCCFEMCGDCDCGDLCSNVCSILLCYQCFQNCGDCSCHCGSKPKRHAYMTTPQKEPKQQQMSRDVELVF